MPRRTKAEVEAAAPEPTMRIVMTEIGELRRFADNPKLHDLEALGASIDEHGFVDPIVVDERSRTMAAGHGRLDDLERRKEAGEPPPARVVERDGKWYVPVLRGVAFKDDEAFRRYVIGSNRIPESGGWDNKMLAGMLSSFDPATLASTGFGEADVVRFMSLAKGPSAPGAFPEVGSNLGTDYCCPKCEYEWSGNPLAGKAAKEARAAAEAPKGKKRAAAR